MEGGGLRDRSQLSLGRLTGSGFGSAGRDDVFSEGDSSNNVGRLFVRDWGRLHEYFGLSTLRMRRGDILGG